MAATAVVALATMSTAQAVSAKGGSASPDPAAAWEHWRTTRPKLRHAVSLHRIHYRGIPWILLHDGMGQQQVRLDASTGTLLEQLDGKSSLEGVLRHADLDPNADPQRLAQLLATLTQLYEGGWITLVGHTDTEMLVKRDQGTSRVRSKTRWMRWLSPRFHLFDPEPLLTRLDTTAKWFFHPASMMTWVLLVMYALLLAWMHWPDLSLYGSQRLDSPLSWVLLVLLYPVIKGLHELGHGLALKAAGGEANGMGITLLVFMPIPYVNARSATLLPDRKNRMLVSGAGIIVEGLLAALALFAWLALPEGLLREASFVVLTLAGISTLLFNGNPLLRYDGYYVLSDWLDIPNLATRANGLFAYLARRYWLGLRAALKPQTAPGELPWLLAYAPLSLGYRLVISVAIAFLLITHIPSLGIVLASWLLAVQWGAPLWRQIAYLLRVSRSDSRSVGPLLRLGLGLALLAALAGLLPLPDSTRVEGIVLMPESTVLRVKADGQFSRQWAMDGDRVERDQPLLTLSDPFLEREIAVMRAHAIELELQKDALDLADRVERDLAEQRLQAAKSELGELLQRSALLTLKSPATGTLRLANHKAWTGRHLHQGDLLGYIAQSEAATVRIVVHQEDLVRIRKGISAISVHLAGEPGRSIQGRLLGQTPLATDQLPSAALGSSGGGAIPVDSRDQKGITALEPVFTLDIALASTSGDPYIGRRAYVTLTHEHDTLFSRLFDTGRRVVLSELGN